MRFVVAALSALVVAGCSGSPQADPAEVGAWSNDQRREMESAVEHHVASGTFFVGPRDDEVEVVGDGDGDMSFSLERPEVVTTFHVACHGAESVEFGFTLDDAAGTSSDSGGAEVECDHRSHEVPVGAAGFDAPGVSRIVIETVVSEPTDVIVVVEGPGQ